MNKDIITIREQPPTTTKENDMDITTLNGSPDAGEISLARGDTTYHLATVYSHPGVTGYARLLAVAPALLEALERAAAAIEEELDATGWDEVEDHPVLADHATALDAARAAIAKAKGGA